MGPSIVSTQESSNPVRAHIRPMLKDPKLTDRDVWQFWDCGGAGPPPTTVGMLVN